MLTYDQSKGGDTRELQSRMVPSQNNWVESPKVQVKFVLADAVFLKLCKDYVFLVLISLVLIRHPCVLIVSE